jgi:hypothetical protein
VALLAVGAAVPMAAIAVLFSEPGRMPDTWAVARPVILACLAVAVLCRGRPLRAAAVVYGVGAFVVYLAPGPIGSNVERLALLFTGMALLAASWLPRPLLVVAVVVAAQWTARVPWADLHHTHRLAIERAASQRLVTVLRELGPVEGRVEVVPFADHGEAEVVARAWPLARGWERQIDYARNAVLYNPQLTAADYYRWLQDNAVQWVALPDVALDPSETGEARLLRNQIPGYLKPVWADEHWQVWRVRDARPLVSGPATLLAIGVSRIRLRATAAGSAVVLVRWTKFWRVTRGVACIAPTADGWTQVSFSEPGPVTLTARVGLGALAGAGSDGSCSQPPPG